MPKLKEKFPPLTKLKKDLDTVFSVYIRQRDSGRCFTCGKVDHWKHMQCGHYISRANLSTRWDEINCNCQCVGCNVFKHGNMDVYALNLQNKYGKDVLKDLNKTKHQPIKIQPWELVNLIAHYKKQIT